MKGKQTKIIAYILIALGLLLALVGFLILPEDVVTQLSLNGSTNYMSRIPALLIPLLITVTFSCFLLKDGEGDEREKKHLMGALLGILLFLILFGVNL